MTPSTKLKPMSFDALEGLSDAERDWVLADEARWRKAHRIAAERADLDVGDLYHAICNLERSPSERLRRGLRSRNDLVRAHGR